MINIHSVYFQVISMLLPPIFHASLFRLLEESSLPETLDTCRKIISKIVQLFRNSPLDLHQYEVIQNDLLIKIVAKKKH